MTVVLDYPLPRTESIIIPVWSQYLIPGEFNIQKWLGVCDDCLFSDVMFSNDTVYTTEAAKTPSSFVKNPNTESSGNNLAVMSDKI